LTNETKQPEAALVKKTSATVQVLSKPELEALEAVVKQYDISLVADAENVITSALLMAEGIAKLEELLTPQVMAKIMSLQGTRLGFLTDKKDNQKYDLATVKRCFIESVLYGFLPVGNEFNIISGNLYGAKNGYTGKLKRHKGFTDFIWSVEILSQNLPGKVAKVKLKASWLQNGLPGKYQDEMHVKINEYMGPDAIRGKAERKLKHAVYHQITDSATTLPEGSVDDAEVFNVTTEPASKAVNLEPGKSFFGDKPVEEATVKPEKAKQQSFISDPEPGPEQYARNVLTENMYQGRKYSELDEEEAKIIDIAARGQTDRRGVTS